MYRPLQCWVPMKNTSCWPGSYFVCFMLLLVSSLLAFPVTACGSAQVAEYESVKWSLWRGLDGDQVAQTVLLVRHTPSCVASVLFLQMRDSDLAVLVSDQKVREGELRELFRDETSSWEIEMKTQTALRFENSKEALDSLRFVAKAKEVSDDRATITILASNVRAVALTYETSEEYEREPILDRLQEQGFSALLARKVPQGVDELIRKVSGLSSDDSEVIPESLGSELIAMIDTILRKRRPSGIELALHDQPSLVLHEEVVEIRLEIVFSEAQLTFLAQFPSFDSLRPMAGTCAETSVPKHLPAQPED